METHNYYAINSCRGAQYKGHHVDMIRIMGQNIGFCRACDGCVRNGGTCILKDDMADILDLYQKSRCTRTCDTSLFLWNQCTNENIHRSYLSYLAAFR